jgi:hypothetical protein
MSFRWVSIFPRSQTKAKETRAALFWQIRDWAGDSHNPEMDPLALNCSAMHAELWNKLWNSHNGVSAIEECFEVLGRGVAGISCRGSRHEEAVA